MQVLDVKLLIPKVHIFTFIIYILLNFLQRNSIRQGTGIFIWRRIGNGIWIWVLFRVLIWWNVYRDIVLFLLLPTPQTKQQISIGMFNTLIRVNNRFRQLKRNLFWRLSHRRYLMKLNVVQTRMLLLGIRGRLLRKVLPKGKTFRNGLFRFVNLSSVKLSLIFHLDL